MICVLSVDTITLLGTLLRYDVFNGIFDITLDFSSVAKLMCSSKTGTMTVMTDMEEELMNTPFVVRKYDLSGTTGIVTLQMNTYHLEVNRG